MSNRLLAIGDIHGCFGPFRRLVEEKIKIRKSDRLVLLGDYIDRGDQSKEVTDYIIDLKENDFDVISLIGNHESMMLSAIENPDYAASWFMNGGYETLYSFGVESASQLNERYLRFFMNLQFYFSQDQYLFVHAGFNDEINDPLEDKYQMIWSRRETYSHPYFSERIIVHGHTPVPLSTCREMVQTRSSVLNIDTGCVYDKTGGYGHLTGIELNTMELFSV
jgi:serine/threonine protein phosphatase 1